MKETDVTKALLNYNREAGASCFASLLKKVGILTTCMNCFGVITAFNTGSTLQFAVSKPSVEQAIPTFSAGCFKMFL